MVKRKKILFLTGSPNQTTQMHKIASHLFLDYDCFFSQVFDDSLAASFLMKTGWIEATVISNTFRKKSEEYYKKHGLISDYRGGTIGNTYDMIVMCSDMLFPKKFKGVKTVFVQEGMTDRITLWSRFVQAIGLPGYYALSTALNGSQNLCDIYCVASEGYKQKFAKGGTNTDKIIVTGMPNFDNIQSYLSNDFPHKNYALIATSDIRELYGFDNRKKFIERSVELAKGRQIIFKTHPNEIQRRAVSEFKKYGPKDSIVLTEGNTNHMVANCDILITQYSTVAYVGLELGKEVYSYFNIDDLKKLAPFQNNGTSAERIAAICSDYIEYAGNGKDYLKKSLTEHYAEELAYAG